MMKSAMRLILLLAALCATLPAFSQAVTLMDLLSGKSVPLSLQVKELNGEWRRITLDDQSGGPSQVMMMMAMMEQIGMVQHTFYTKGQTITLSEQMYLIAYAPPQPAIDLTAIRNGGMPPMRDPLTAETKLTLSLLNLRTAGSITDIRPFKLEDELKMGDEQRKLLDNARRKAQQTESMNNLRQVSVALQMYIQDHDETFPSLKNAAELKAALKIYVDEDRLLRCPRTQEPYMPNASLSTMALGDLKNPTDMVMAFEVSADEDGRRCVAFVDGHVSLLTEAEWAEAKKKSGIK
ncbi:MAG: hypothetical protein ACYDBB_08285 [Armatimonadota bacterium]